MYLSISLHSNIFQHWSLSLAATAGTSTCPFLSMFLVLLVSFFFAASLSPLLCIGFQGWNEASCAYPRAWLGVQGEGQRVGTCPLRGQPAPLCMHLVVLFACWLIIWLMDHSIGDQEGRWCLVEGSFCHFSAYDLIEPDLAPNLQTLLGSQRLLEALAQSFINVPMLIINPCGCFIKQISKT